jgi:glyoxylase-like metal-dependent hydrolase (beta-lactamase superfamily II)
MDRSPAGSRQRVSPTRIGRDTYLVHQVQEANGGRGSFFVNSMVITGQEPVIVDTGTSSNAAQWLDDVFGIVEPGDVRWIFLSHDDADHAGNLVDVTAACPHAVVVRGRAMYDLHSTLFALPVRDLPRTAAGLGLDCRRDPSSTERAPQATRAL